MSRLRSVTAAATLAIGIPAGSWAEPLACADGNFFTENAGEDADLICGIAARASEQLSTCNLAVPSPVTIAVAEALQDQCLGLYHCGQNRIEILAPGAYAPLRAAGEASAFASVSDDAFFESVIRHELAHAALDGMPCPFGSCTVGQEYVAYTMQLRFLPEPDLIAFEGDMKIDGPVSRDMLSGVMLMMAPQIFARRAWLHLKAREDACGFIGQIARGEVLLDYEHP